MANQSSTETPGFDAGLEVGGTSHGRISPQPASDRLKESTNRRLKDEEINESLIEKDN